MCIEHLYIVLGKLKMYLLLHRCGKSSILLRLGLKIPHSVSYLVVGVLLLLLLLDVELDSSFVLEHCLGDRVPS